MTVDVLLEMIRNAEEETARGHKSLRHDFRELAERLDEIEHRQGNVIGRVERIEKQPPPKVDALSLQFDTKLVMAIVLFAVTVFSANWASTSSMRSDISDIRRSQTLADERWAALRDTITDIKKRSELQSYDIQDLQKAIMALKSAK